MQGWAISSSNAVSPTKFPLLQLEMDSQRAYFQNSPIVLHLACKVLSMENLESVASLTLLGPMGNQN